MAITYKLVFLASFLLLTNLWQAFRVLNGYWIPRFIQRRWHMFWSGLWNKCRSRLLRILQDEDPVRKKPLEDVMGKSLFKMPHVIKADQERKRKEILQDGAEVELSEVIFDGSGTSTEIVAGRFRQIDEDRLDDAFSDVRIKDVPTEYAENGGRTVPDGMAEGTSFDDLDKAVRTVKDRMATVNDRHHAGKVFHEMDGNEFFNMYIRNHQEYEARIHDLVGQYLASPAGISKKQAANKTTMRKSVRNVPKVPDNIEDFDIMDYV